MRFHTDPSIHDNDLFRERHSLKRTVSRLVNNLIAERKTIPEIQKQVYAIQAVQGWPETYIEAMIKAALPKITPISAAALNQKKFEPIRFAVPKLVPEGLTTLAGQLHIGKSFLCLNMALAVASGSLAVGSIPIPTPSKVLYCALEDLEKRLQSRLRRLVPDDNIPENLHFLPLGGFPSMLDKHGVSLLQDLIDAHGYQFVIVDPWQCVKPKKSEHRNTNLDKDDSELLGELQAFAAQRGVAILIVHLDDISGLNRIQMIPDALLSLQKKNGSIVCSVAGRDFESREFVMSFNKGHWQIEGEVDTAFDAKKLGWRRYSTVLNRDSVKGILKTLLKWALYLITFFWPS